MTGPATPSIGNVLVIDDDRFLLDTYVMKFQRAGFNVHASLSAADGLQALRDGFPADAVLFSMGMRECDGYAILQKLKDEKLAERAAKIALSNDVTENDTTKAGDLGAARCIAKATTMPSEVVDCAREEIAKLKR